MLIDPVVVYGFGNGVNLQPSYYNDGNVSFAWDIMQKYDQIKSLRIEVEPDKVSLAHDWIKQASEHGYNIIVTYHKFENNGKDPIKFLLNAANWWVDNYESLNESGNFTINMMNEWSSHRLSSIDYANAYNQAIALVRTVYNGDIIIDIPGYAQEINKAVNASSLLIDKEGYINKLIFSVHIYPMGFQTKSEPGSVSELVSESESESEELEKIHWLTSNDLDILLTTGRPCMIGEWGLRPYHKPDNVTDIVIHAKNIGFLSIIAWAWNGDGNDLNMMTPSWNDDPTATEFTESDYFYRIIDYL